MFTVAALYQFAPFDDPAALRAPLLDLCTAKGIKGIILLAHEGINGTIAGSDDGIAAVLDHIRALPGCTDIDVKFSCAAMAPFLRMKVRLKKEIVTLGLPHVDPSRQTGKYVQPEEWNAIVTDPDTIIIDTRNDFEVELGSFTGAVNPGTQSFSDFPAWFADYRKTLPAAPKVAMFCTGGIRCEKSTAFLKSEGITDVVHLKGGILRYLETVPADQSLWSGECFVFDERVSVGHGLTLGTTTQCRACRMPVTEADRASPLYVEGVQCPACASTRTDEQRLRYAERQRQVEKAEAEGRPHLGDGAQG